MQSAAMNAAGNMVGATASDTPHSKEANKVSSAPRAPHPTLSQLPEKRPLEDSEIQAGDAEGAARAMSAPLRRPSSPNASSAPITEASGPYTGGTVNQHPNVDAVQAKNASSAQNAGEAVETVHFRVGVSEDRNQKCRRTMEDSHAFVYDFGGVKGQGYFAVFDGHAGKHAAEWCGANFHKYLLQQLRDGQDSQPIPDLLNATFHVVDSELSKLSAEDGTHSGCTAVTAFLRLEDEDGNAVQLEQDPDSAVGSSVNRGGASHSNAGDEVASSDLHGGAPLESHKSPATASEAEDERKRKFGDGSHREKLKSFFSSGSGDDKASSATTTESGSRPPLSTTTSTDLGNSEKDRAAEGVEKPATAKNVAKRTLYTANVGDARAVLSRGGKAVRLTYDHKGSDAQEAKRITDAGGFVMNNRVNGVLAVTRSLGDSSMKEFVVGSPYTTETTLGDDDDFLIVACDGLWDVCEDQTAVDLIRDVKSAQQASQVLLEHALSNFSTDNLSVLVVALQPGQMTK